MLDIVVELVSIDIKHHVAKLGAKETIFDDSLCYVCTPRS